MIAAYGGGRNMIRGLRLNGPMAKEIEHWQKFGPPAGLHLGISWFAAQGL